MEFKSIKKWVDEAMRVLVGVLIILSVVYVLRKLFGTEIPLTNRDAVMLVIGNLMAWGTQFVNFNYGTSKSSTDKTDIIANSTPNKP